MGSDLKNSREAIGDADVDSGAKRTEVAALRATPGCRGLMKEVGIRHLAVVISAAAARPHLSSISPRFRQTICGLGHMDLTFSEWEDGSFRRNVSVEAHLCATLFPVKWKDRSSRPDGKLVFTPDDLQSAPPPELHLSTGPG